MQIRKTVIEMVIVKKKKKIAIFAVTPDPGKDSLISSLYQYRQQLWKLKQNIVFAAQVTQNMDLEKNSAHKQMK